MGKSVTRNTKVPFGRPGNKGRELGQQPVEFLKWMASKLWNTDKHAWAIASKEELKRREKLGEEMRTEQELVKAADEFLRKHDIDPENL